MTRKRDFWSAGACCLLLFGVLTTTRAAGLPPYSLIYDPARNPFSDSRAALDLARQSGRRVLIELGGGWCRWCQLLDRFLSDNQEVRQALQRRFVVVKINVSDANGNADFLAGLPPLPGYPHIFVARRDGHIIHSQDTAELLENGRYSQQRVLAFLERWRIPDDDNGAAR